MQSFEQKTPKKMELLAPAGNAEQLAMSINYGADAVYLGLNKFGARAKAGFDIAILGEHIKYAHLFDVKVYAVVNTIIKLSEIDDALDLIKQAHNLGVDAFIVQDIGLVKQIRQKMPQIELHASTQMGIHNALGAQFAKDLGLKRVVLSREATLLDISDIKQNVDIEVEYFAHGALCVCFSGNCYFSSLVSGYSGNRGKCMQLCRKKYRVDYGGSKSEGYYLSPKDICLLDEIERLRQFGVDSIKIEGRLRSPQYAAETVRVYRKALDGLTVTKEDGDFLKIAFNRGDFSKGYLLGGDDILYPSVQGNIGLKVGTVTSLNPFKLSGQACLSLGDGMKFLRKGLEIGGGIVLKNGEIGTDAQLQIGDEVRLTLSQGRQKALSEQKRRLPLEIEAQFLKNKPAQIKLKCKGNAITFLSDKLLEGAKNQPVSKEDLKIGLERLGATHFNAEKVSVETDGVFIAKSQLNQYRNQAVELLMNEMLSRYEKPIIQDIGSAMSDITLDFVDTGSIAVILEDINQLNERILACSKYVIYSPKHYSVDSILGFKAAAGDKFALNLPIICRKEDCKLLSGIISQCGIRRVVSNNLYGLKLAERHENMMVIAGLGHNLVNNAFGFSEYIQSIESEQLPKNGAYIYAFGKYPLMNLTHCVKKHLGADCSKCHDEVEYTDEMGNKFDLRRIKIHDCYFQLVNRTPIYIKSAFKNHKKLNILLDFSGYEAHQIEGILDQLFKGELPFKTTVGLIGKKLY